MKKLTTIILFALASASYALQGGPSQPDYVQFEPSGMQDMVNLLNGDFSYQIPLSDVPSPYGNYPLSISYHAGISPQQEASWVGLGWSLNPGAINRDVRGVPDDQIHGGTLGYIYQYSYARAWSIDVAYSNGVFSVGQTFASSDDMCGFSATLGWQIAGVARVGFTVGSDEVGLTASAGYGYAQLNAGLVYSRKNGRARAYVGASVGGTGAGDIDASVGAQLSTGSGASAHAGFGTSTAGVGMTMSSEGVSASGSVGAASFYTSEKGAGVFAYAGGGGLTVSNSPNSGTSKISHAGFAVIVPTKIGVFSGGYGQSLNEFWIRAQTLDDVYGYMYQAGPAIDVRTVNNVSGLPDVTTGNIKPLLGKGWETDVKGRSLESMGKEDMSPAYDMYHVSSEGVRGTFRPFAREVHQLYKKISNEKTSGHEELRSYSPALVDDKDTKWPSKDEFKRDKNGDFLAENDYKDYAYCLHSSGECSVYGLYKTNFRNRGNRLVFDSDENHFEERGGVRFLFVGDGGGYYESEGIDESRKRSRDKVSDSLLNRKVGNFEYALYGSKKIEPLFEGDSPIGALAGFVITGANGYKYYFKQPVRSFLKVDYSINREKGMPVFADKSQNASDGMLDTLIKYGPLAFLPSYGTMKLVESLFGSAPLPEKCKPEESKKTDDYFYSYAANINPYATQWLLTEIRGADYLKLGDKEIGYNVKFTYSDEPSMYLWRTPYARPGLDETELPNFRVGRNSFTPEGCDARMYQASFGMKEYVYLKSIETATHKVEFELNDEERVDGKGWETDAASMPPILTQVAIGLKIKDKADTVEDKINPVSAQIKVPDGCILAGNILDPKCYKIYWHHNVTLRPKYVYVNINLPQYVLDNIYDSEIEIFGLDIYNKSMEHYISKEGIFVFEADQKTSETLGKDNFVLKDMSDKRKFKVVPNSFKKTVGEDSKAGLYRFEIKSSYEEVKLNYLVKDIASHVQNLENGDTLIVGLDGDLIRNLYVDWSKFFIVSSPDKLGENEMRYLTKISYFNKGDDVAYKEYQFEYDYSLQPKTLNSYCRGRYPRENSIEDILTSPDSVGVDICKRNQTSNSLYGKLTLRSITEKGCQNGKCTSLPPFTFSYNMPSATSTRISARGGWIDYFQENLAPPDDDDNSYDVENIDDAYFADFTDLDATILASSNMVDEYGFWSNSANPENHKVDQSFADFGASAWSLNKVVDPTGGNLEVEYERDRYGAGIDYSQDKRTVDVDGFDECSEYDEVASKYSSNLCIVVTPLYWREQCLGPRSAYWDSEKPMGFQGNEFAYLDSMEAKKGANVFFNLIVQLRQKAGCKSGFGKCTRHRSVAVVGDGILEEIYERESSRILVLNRRAEDLFIAGQKGADKINTKKWSFTGGSRSGYMWTGKKLDQVKAGDLRVTRLTRHDIGLKSLTSYDYADGEIAQLSDSSYTAVLGNRFYSSKISEAIPDVHLDPISRVVGIDDKDLMYLPSPQITYPKVTVKSSSEDISSYNGSTEFYYITPETGVPEEFVDPVTLDSLKPFVKLSIIYTTSEPDAMTPIPGIKIPKMGTYNAEVFEVALLDAQRGLLAGTEWKTIALISGDNVPLYFYSDNANSAKYIAVRRPASTTQIIEELWNPNATIESLKSPFTKYNDVTVSIYGGTDDFVSVLSKRSQKEGFVPILYKKSVYDKVAIDLESSLDGRIDIRSEKQFMVDYESKVTYHDLSAFLGQNYKIVSKRGVGDNAVVFRMDSSVYSTVVTDVLDKDIPDEKKYKIGRQIEKWSYDSQMQCVDGDGDEDIDGAKNICELEATDLYIRRIPDKNLASIHKDFEYIRYPAFQIGSVNYVGHDNQTAVFDPQKFGKTELHNHAYEALTGTPTATLATIKTDEGKTLRKLTNVIPYYMAAYEKSEGKWKHYYLSDSMFLRNMLTQNYMEEIYTDTLKNVKDTSWKKVKKIEKLRSFSISPYRFITKNEDSDGEGLFDDVAGSLPILAMGTFQSRTEPSAIWPDAMKYVNGLLSYHNDTLDYHDTVPSLYDYSGEQIVALDRNLKVTETRDAFKRRMTALFPKDGMFQLGLFFPAKRSEVGAVLPYRNSTYNTTNCSKLKQESVNGEIEIGDSQKTLSCKVSTLSGNLIKEYRIWTPTDGWKTKREIISVNNLVETTQDVKLKIPANGKLNYYRVYPESAESKIFVYDKYSNLIQIVAEDNTSTYYEYDPMGHLVQIRNDDGVSFKAHHREFMNDAAVSNGRGE